MNWTFWLGLAVLSLLTLGALGFVFAKSKGGDKRVRMRRVAPFALAAILFFALGTFALAYFVPPRQTRVITAATPSETAPQTPQLADAADQHGYRSERIANSFRNQNPAGRSSPNHERVENDRNRPGASRRARRRRSAGRGQNRFARGINDRLGGRARRADRHGRADSGRFRSDRTRIAATRSRSPAARSRSANGWKSETRCCSCRASRPSSAPKRSQARTQLAQAQRELRRSENLVEVGAVPRKESKKRKPPSKSPSRRSLPPSSRSAFSKTRSNRPTPDKRFSARRASISRRARFR